MKNFIIILLLMLIGCKSSVSNKKADFLSKENSDNYTNTPHRQSLHNLRSYQAEKSKFAVLYKDSIYSLAHFKNKIGFADQEKFKSMKVIRDSSTIAQKYSLKNYNALIILK